MITKKSRYDLNAIKASLIATAKAGLPRPTYSSPQGQWLSRMSSPSTTYYDAAFATEIKGIRPEWWSRSAATGNTNLAYIKNTRTWDERSVSSLKKLVVAGLTFSEIGDLLDVSRNTVAGVLYRARQHEAAAQA